MLRDPSLPRATTELESFIVDLVDRPPILKATQSDEYNTVCHTLQVALPQPCPPQIAPQPVAASETEHDTADTHLTACLSSLYGFFTADMASSDTLQVPRTLLRIAGCFPPGSAAHWKSRTPHPVEFNPPCQYFLAASSITAPFSELGALATLS